MKQYILFLWLYVFLSACQSNPEPKEIIHSDLKQVFEDFELLGMSVGLIANGELYYSGSFGIANETRQQAMTTDTYLRIASISKFFSSLAVMQLWEQNLVALDTPASVYLGWELLNPLFPDEPITLRHLMDHRSGIRDGSGYGDFLQNMISQKSHIRSLFMPDSTYYTEDMFADHPPGGYFQYTNCTWGLVATVIEQVSGKRFDRYCRDHIFKPMGIKSSFNVTDIPTEDMAALYRFRDSTWVAQVDDFSEQPAKDRAYPGYIPGTNGLIYAPQGGLRTSLNDLWITAKMLFQGGQIAGTSIIKPTTLSYFQRDPWKYDGENGDTWNNFWHSYTKGMHFIQNKPNADIIFPDRLLWGHPGIAYGLLSDFYIDPETQSGVIFITNGCKNEYEYAQNSSFYQVEEAVFKVLYPHLKSLESE
jgi:CubicO group peptidase (beta-lactamase class C family)